jgi:hypothetical protein
MVKKKTRHPQSTVDSFKYLSLKITEKQHRKLKIKLTKEEKSIRSLLIDAVDRYLTNN